MRRLMTDESQQTIILSVKWSYLNKNPNECINGHWNLVDNNSSIFLKCWSSITAFPRYCYGIYCIKLRWNNYGLTLRKYRYIRSINMLNFNQLISYQLQNDKSRYIRVLFWRSMTSHLIAFCMSITFE